MSSPTTAATDWLAACGPFCAVTPAPPHCGLSAAPDGGPADVGGSGWHRLTELAGPHGQAERRVALTRTALAGVAGRPVELIEVRVAASVAHLGVLARVLSPLLALAADGRAVVPAAHEVWWRNELGGAFPLALPVPVLAAPPAPVIDEEGWSGAVHRLLDGVDAAFAPLLTSVPTRRGNLASAVNGAARAVLGAVAGTPEGADRALRESALGDRAVAADRVRRLGTALLHRPDLVDVAQGRAGEPGFRRRSCCLIYRIAGLDGPPNRSGLCGDCVLAAPATGTP